MKTTIQYILVALLLVCASSITGCTQPQQTPTPLPIPSLPPTENRNVSTGGALLYHDEPDSNYSLLVVAPSGNLTATPNNSGKFNVVLPADATAVYVLYDGAVVVAYGPPFAAGQRFDVNTVNGLGVR